MSDQNRQELHHTHNTSITRISSRLENLARFQHTYEFATHRVTAAEMPRLWKGPGEQMSDPTAVIAHTIATVGFAQAILV